MIAVGRKPAAFAASARPAGAALDSPPEPANAGALPSRPPIEDDPAGDALPVPETLRRPVAPETSEVAELTVPPPLDVRDEEPLEEETVETAEETVFFTVDTAPDAAFFTVATGADAVVVGAGAGGSLGAGGGLTGTGGGGGVTGTVVVTVGTDTGGVTVGTETDVVGNGGVGRPAASAPPATAPAPSSARALTMAAALTHV